MKNKWKEYKMAPCTTESTLQSAEVKAEKEMLLAIRKTCEMSVFLDMLEPHRAPTLGLDIMHISPLSYIADAHVSWQLYPKGAITLWLYSACILGMILPSDRRNNAMLGKRITGRRVRKLISETSIKEYITHILTQKRNVRFLSEFLLL